MTLAQAVRAPRARRAYVRPSRAAHRRAARREARASWELRSFAAACGAIVALFLFVLLYVSQTTGVAALGYEVQRLDAARDELRRQNALLEIESARLDSPARIEADAQRLGLVRAVTIRVLPPETIAAKR